MRVLDAILLVVAFSRLYAVDIPALYLSWYKDPTTTMTIQWHTFADVSNDAIQFKAEGEPNWRQSQGTHVPLADRLVHTITLEGLQPDTDHLFQITGDAAIYRFKTAPQSLDKPLAFVIGGDLYQTTKLFRKMNSVVFEKKPLFVAIGGDIAYAIKPNILFFSGSPIDHWFSFLKEWKEQMIYPDGQIIPMLLGIGNHDISEGSEDLFFTLFTFPEKKFYRALDFSKYLSLIFLDTDHWDPIEGDQTAWLDQALTLRKSISYLFPIYHEGAYPSYYPYDGEIPTKIRKYWCPLFEKNQLPVAFEHHNHTFKKTFPILNEQKDPSGVIYLGDGCWGAVPRVPKNMWYLDKKAKKNNVYFLELHPEKATIEAIDISGKLLDHLTIKPR